MEGGPLVVRLMPHVSPSLDQLPDSEREGHVSVVERGARDVSTFMSGNMAFKRMQRLPVKAGINTILFFNSRGAFFFKLL